MQASDPAIVFQLEMDNEKFDVETYAGAYRSLMELIRDKFYPEDFGECGGTGRCGTCIVEVAWSGEKSFQRERNEETTIRNSGIENPAARLSCQILINEDLNNADIRKIK